VNFRHIPDIHHGESEVRTAPSGGRRAATLDTCTTGSSPLRTAAPRTISAAHTLVWHMRRAVRESAGKTAAACRTASQRAMASSTDRGAVKSPSTDSTSATPSGERLLATRSRDRTSSRT
jgi:hypothetical protein